MRYALKYLVDVPHLQTLGDQFHRVTGISSAILSADGEVLTSSGPRSICDDLHRQAPGMENLCARFDASRHRALDSQGAFVIFECPARLVAASSPVMIEGVEVGRVVAGPVLLQPVDAALEDSCREQARRLALDASTLLSACRHAPVHPLDRFRDALAFLANMAQLIADIGLARRRELKAADHLRTGQERYRRLFNSTPVATAELDVTGLLELRASLAGLPSREVAALLSSGGAHNAEARNSISLLGINAAARQFFGVSPHDEPSGTALRGATASLAGLIVDDILCILAGKRGCSGETTVPTVAGVRHVFWRWTAELPDADGTVRYLISFVDLTERRQTEIALRENEQRLRLQGMVLDQIQDHVTITDLGGRITYVNDAMCRLHGIPREQVLGQSAECCGDTPARTAVPSEIIQRTRAEGEWRGEVVNTDGAGNSHVMDCRTRLVRDAGGAPVAFCSIATDITDRKRAGEEREKLQSQLHQALKMESIGRLAGGVAHDFNNQLAGIMGYAELLASSLQDNQLRQYAEHIVTASTRASGLTRQLLAFARKGKYASVPVDLHVIIAEVLGLIRRGIDKRIDIRADLAAHSAFTLGDPSQLQNAVLNLAINSADAMPSGGILTVSTALVDLDADAASLEVTPGRYVRLSVTDTGVGMPPEVLRHIFEPFFTTKEQGKGTGLGLAAVYGTVRNHHGAICVQSQPGRGSSFTLFLPFHAATPAPAAPAPSARGHGHVLVVDDEPLVAQSAAEMLRRSGYTASVCHSGADAIRLYRDSWRSIDLVLFDMAMPGMDGLATFVSLREVNPAIKALLTSGHGVTDEAQRILDQGALGFLEKPYRIGELSTALRAQGL